MLTSSRWRRKHYGRSCSQTWSPWPEPGEHSSVTISRSRAVASRPGLHWVAKVGVSWLSLGASSISATTSFGHLGPLASGALDPLDRLQRGPAPDLHRCGRRGFRGVWPGVLLGRRVPRLCGRLRALRRARPAPDGMNQLMAARQESGGSGCPGGAPPMPQPTASGERCSGSASAN